MKWRNQLLALFCLALFVAGGVFYFRHWVVQKPYGIILFIGEGLDARSLATARVAAGSGDKLLAIDRLPFSALLRNHSHDSATPDSAAAATAIATGTKVNNGAIAISPRGERLDSILRIARSRGHMVGLVTDGSLTAPTAAAFYGHGHATESRAAFAEELVQRASIDVVLGGGAADFASVDAGGTRPDDRDLIAELRDEGYEVVRNLQDLEDVPRWRRAKLFGLFSEAELDYGQDVERLDDQPTLADLVRRAIELLQYSRTGYVLVVDAALARKARDETVPQQAVNEVLELDRALTVALEYAGNKAAVFVCGDTSVAAKSERHNVDPVPMSSDSARYPAGAEPSTQPSSDQSATPAEGEISTPSPEPVTAAAEETPTENELTAPPAESPTATTAATPPESSTAELPQTATAAEDAIVFGIGLGAEALHGSMDDTEVFEIIRDNL